MTGDRHLARYPLPLDDEGRRDELLTANTDALALHYPNRDGVCPICRVRACPVRAAAVRTLRDAGVLATALPVCEPVRPAWWCDRHGAPWPCGPARVALGDMHGYDPAGRARLAVHMAARLVDAARETTTPRGELVERMIGWVEPWRG